MVGVCRQYFEEKISGAQKMRGGADNRSSLCEGGGTDSLKGVRIVEGIICVY